MNFIKDILRGIVIGIANAIPGVSGGTMAVSMGVYDKIIHAVTHFLKELKKSILTLLPIGIGAAIGIGGLAFIIDYLFGKFPVQTNFMFIGLVVGGLPLILKELKGKKIGIGHILCGVIFFAVVVIMPIIGNKVSNEVVLTIDPISLIKLFFVGIIAAATMVIPGVSGSMMFTIMGYYQPIISEIKNFIQSLVTLDFDGVLHSTAILAPLAIGAVLGIVLIAKLIEFVFNKYSDYAYASIVGLVAASPVAILYNYIASSGTSHFNAVSVLVGIVLLVIGSIVAFKLSGEPETESKDENKEALKNDTKEVE